MEVPWFGVLVCGVPVLRVLVAKVRIEGVLTKGARRAGMPGR